MKVITFINIPFIINITGYYLEDGSYTCLHLGVLFFYLELKTLRGYFFPKIGLEIGIG